MNEIKTSKGLIDELFDKLDEWRNLPAYQLERRADIFFSLYLPDIINGKFKQEVEYLIPEFPLRLGDVYREIKLDKPNQSFKIDYMAVCNTTRKVFLIELKTDDGSRNAKQDWYLEIAKSNNIKKLVDGVLGICKETRSKKKYGNLVSTLAKIGWIDQPTMANTSQNYDITIVYIQPNKDKSDNIIITFSDIISFLSHRNDDLTQRFVRSLNIWKINPNG